MSYSDFFEAALLTLLFLLDLIVVRWIFIDEHQRESAPAVVWKYLQWRLETSPLGGGQGEVCSKQQ